MIIKYSEMSGIKLTVLVPLLDKQIKYAVSKFGSEDGQSDAKIIYTLVICYSNGRCHEYAEFANQLVTFCPDVLDILTFEESDHNDIKIEWSKLVKLAQPPQNEESPTELQNIKKKNKLIFVTPVQA